MRKYVAAGVSVLSLLVAVLVAWNLSKPVITMSPTALCGMGEHTHTESCYATILTCGLTEGADHTHDASCYGQVLVCDIPEHKHSSSCYPAAVSEVIVNPVNPDDAQSADDNQFAYGIPEESDEPFWPEDPGDDPVVIEPVVPVYEPVEPENPDQPTEPTDPTQEPIPTMAPENPDEPVNIAAWIDHLNVNPALVTAGQTATFTFATRNARELYYEITKDGYSIERGILPGNETIHNFTPDQPGQYVMTLTAVAEDGSFNQAYTVLTSVVGDELAVALATESRSAFAGDTVHFTITANGGAEPISWLITVMQGNTKIYESKDPAAWLDIYTQAVTQPSTLSVKVTLTDATGQTATSSVEIPLSVRAGEDDTPWLTALANYIYVQKWPEDVLGIAYTQHGYRESGLNFIIREDGSRQGWTRYGEWYGAPYDEWCAMFASWCLHNAGVPRAEFPLEGNCQRWIAALKECKPESLFMPARYIENVEDPENPNVFNQVENVNIPTPGDLIFFDWNVDGVANHVGIVSAVQPVMIVINEDSEPIERIELTTIEGNSGKSVRERRYYVDDRRIMGYGMVNKAFENYLVRDVRELLYNGEDYNIKVSYSGLAGIPDEAQLRVREIAPGTEEYDAYAGQTDAMLGESGESIFNFARYFDIAFESEGQVYEPQTPVQVEINFNDTIEVSQDAELKAIHFKDEQTEVLDLDTGVNPDAVDAVTFETDSFSVFAIVESGAMYTRVITAQGETYTIVVTYDSAAGIPAGARLSAQEILPGTLAFNECLQRSMEALAIESGLDADTNLVNPDLPTLSFARFFDITILDETGAEIEPKTPVDVQILYNDAISLNYGESLNVVHFAEAGTELIDAELSNASPVETQEPVGAVVSFTQDSFSITGTVVWQELRERFLSSSGQIFEVTVTYYDDAMIPKDAQLRVTEYAEDSEEYRAVMAMTDAAADEAEVPQMVVGAEASEDGVPQLVVDEGGLEDGVPQLVVGEAPTQEAPQRTFVLDISIVDAAGNKIEPARPVDVKIEVIHPESDPEVFARGVQVVHLKDVDGELVPETITIDREFVTLNGEDAEAAAGALVTKTINFSVDSFSYFRMRWQDSTGEQVAGARLFVGYEVNVPQDGGGTKKTFHEFAAGELDSNARPQLKRIEGSGQGTLATNASGVDVNTLTTGDVYSLDAATKSGSTLKAYYLTPSQVKANPDNAISSGGYLEIQPKLRVYEDTATGKKYWQYTTDGTWNSANIVENWSEVYVVYTDHDFEYNRAKKLDEEGNPIDGQYVQGGSQWKDPALQDASTWGEPSHKKMISINGVDANNTASRGDGTYSLELSVTAATREQTVYSKSDVIFVLDTTGSMSSGSGYNGMTRKELANNALREFVTAITEPNKTHPDAVRVSVVTFANDASIKEPGTTDISTAIDAAQIGGTGGMTNWEVGLKAASRIETRADAKQYLIFISDGQPNLRVTAGRWDDREYYDAWGNFRRNADYANKNEPTSNIYHRWDDFYGSAGQAYMYGWGRDGYGANNIDYRMCYYQARDFAKMIKAADMSFSTVNAFPSTGNPQWMRYLAEDGNGSYHEASDPESFVRAFAPLVKAITGSDTYYNLTVNDGVTNLTATALVEWSATNLTHYRYKEKLPTARPPYLSDSDIAAHNWQRWAVDGVDPANPGVDAETLRSWAWAKLSDADKKIYAPKAWENMTPDEKANYIWPDYPGDNDHLVGDSTNGNRPVHKAYQDPNTGSVIWNIMTYDPSKPGRTDDYMLEDGMTYTVGFTVWPKQRAYDILADYENGLFTLTADANGNITGMKDKNGNTLTPDANGNYPVKVDNEYITTNDLKQLKLQDGHLHLRTNQSNDDPNDPNVYLSYRVMTTTTDENGNPVTTLSDPKTVLYNDVPSIVLDSTKIRVYKEWEDDLDSTKLAQLIEEDPYFAAKLILLQSERGRDFASETLGAFSHDDDPYIYGGYTKDSNGNYTYNYEIDLKPTYDVVNEPHTGHVTNIKFPYAEASLPVGLGVSHLTGIDPENNKTPHYSYVPITFPDGARLPDGTIASGDTVKNFWILDEGYKYMLREVNRDAAFTLEVEDYHPMLLDGKLYEVELQADGFITETRPGGEVVTRPKYVSGVIHRVNQHAAASSEVAEPDQYVLASSGLVATNKLRPHITLEKFILGHDNRFLYQKDTSGNIVTSTETISYGDKTATMSGDNAYKMRPNDQFTIHVEIATPDKITDFSRMNYVIYPEYADEMVELGLLTQDEINSWINHELGTEGSGYTINGVRYNPPAGGLVDAPGKIPFQPHALDAEGNPWDENSDGHTRFEADIVVTANQKVRIYNVPVGSIVRFTEKTEDGKMPDGYTLGFYEVDWVDLNKNQMDNWFWGSDETLASLNASKADPDNADAKYPENWEKQGELVDEDGYGVTGTVHHWDINYDVDVFNYFDSFEVEIKKISTGTTIITGGEPEEETRLFEIGLPSWTEPLWPERSYTGEDAMFWFSGYDFAYNGYAEPMSIGLVGRDDVQNMSIPIVDNYPDYPADEPLNPGEVRARLKATVVRPTGSENPKAQGWYEAVDLDGWLWLAQTTDTTVDSYKRYYVLGGSGSSGGSTGTVIDNSKTPGLEGAVFALYKFDESFENGGTNGTRVARAKNRAIKIAPNGDLDEIGSYVNIHKENPVTGNDNSRDGGDIINAATYNALRNSSTYPKVDEEGYYYDQNGTKRNDIQYKPFGSMTPNSTTSKWAVPVTNTSGRKLIDLTTDADGMISFGTLPMGTYYLVETTGLPGYVLPTSATKIEVKSTGITYTQPGNAGSSSNGTVYMRRETDAAGRTITIYELVITNAPLDLVLPNTGGPGTLPYALGGLALMALSAVLYGCGLRRKGERRFMR